MIKTTFDTSTLDPGTLELHQTASKRFPYSVTVETSYPELDMADTWLEQQIGPKDTAWTQVWLDKVDYDYGFANFFFSHPHHGEMFEQEIPAFYATGPRGKWRTAGRSKDDGQVRFVYLDDSHK